MSDMSEAVHAQFDHVDRSKRIVRVGWTRKQYLDDARAQMRHIDGSVLDLVNGHPLAMLDEIDALQAALTTLAEAAGRLLGGWAEATPEVGIEMRERLAKAEDAAWTVLRGEGK